MNPIPAKINLPIQGQGPKNTIQTDLQRESKFSNSDIHISDIILSKKYSTPRAFTVSHLQIFLDTRAAK